METTTQDVIRDLAMLWKEPTRNFLEYIVDISAPICVDEVDEDVLAAFNECYENEREIGMRMLEVAIRLGIRPDKPSFGLLASTYNFLRPRVLGEAFVSMSGPELEGLKARRAGYEGAEELNERSLRHILDDYIASRESSKKKIEKILAAASSTEGDAGGDAEEEEASVAVAEGEFPWHNEDLSLEQRMKLAEGKGLFEKLFAAMAQTDCTACGYDCEGYAQAIADGEDTDLTKCAPGEIETQEVLEKLMAK